MEYVTGKRFFKISTERKLSRGECCQSILIVYNFIENLITEPTGLYLMKLL